MNKLEVSHLMPFFQYGLKVKHKNLIWIVQSIDLRRVAVLERSEQEGSGRTVSRSALVPFEEFTPILRSIKKIFMPITHKWETFVPSEWLVNNRECDVEYDFMEALEDDPACYDSKVQFAPFSIHCKLCEWKFDLFSLIETGLAIDADQLTPNPYKI